MDSRQSMLEVVRKDSMISTTEAFHKLVENDVKKFEYSSFTDIHRIGRGASANVFSATLENENYALKHVTDEEMLRVATRELQILHKVDHINVIKFYGISEEIDVGSITYEIPENKIPIDDSEEPPFLLNELWSEFRDSTNRGNEFQQISKKIKDLIEKYGKNLEAMFDELKNLPDDTNAQCLLGFFYFIGIGTNKQLDKSFKIFQQVADKNNSVGQFYLGECYRCGYGIKKDPKNAIYWHKSASEAKKQLSQLSPRNRGFFFKAKENDIQSDGNNKALNTEH
ncbi:6924_t:CDS:2 [Dentiscutata heterogama]|uniref:6924_t:CDS:1 n=1 Tax=Dentiscutata heterogama TaxID=1316150 RepID=A0ACA9KQ28_9GLOM|nr:6924_t:CDS:2 [Dentiscutata heterogama]